MVSKKLLGLLLVIIVISGAVVYLNPSILDNFANLGQNTILTPPQNLFVQLQDSANIVGNKLNGGFWVFNVAVTANDDIAGVILPKNQTGSVTYQGATKALQTGAKIEIKIDPGQPYVIRTIQEKNMHPVSGFVAPAATGNGKTVDPLTVRYYDWGEGSSWRVYTPFTVSVYKDGSLVGKQEFNSVGKASIQNIVTNEGTVRVEMPGTLGNNYLSPAFPAQIAILKGYSNVYDWTQIQSLVSGSSTSSSTYATYWYGSSRTTHNPPQANNPTVVIGGVLGNMYLPSKYGGWSGHDSGGKAEPVRPVIGQSDKSTLPESERGFYSLTEFLEQGKGIQNLATTLFNTRSTGNVGSLWQKASFATDEYGQTALRLDVPWGTYGTPMVNIRVPTELADTWIDQPAVANTKVSAVWESTGAKYRDSYGADRIAVTLTNEASVTASAKVYASATVSKLGITPSDPITVPNLEPNIPQTVYFSATNLGVEADVEDVPITIVAYDSYSNTETGRDTVYATLKATLTTGTTTLVLHVVEKGTSTPIVGLPMTLQYSNQAPTVYSNANGEISMTLTNPQGGAFTGMLIVNSQPYTTASGLPYKAATASYSIANPTAYSLTYEVERADKGPGGNPLDWVLIAIVAIVIAVIAAVGVGVYMKTRKGHRRRR